MDYRQLFEAVRRRPRMYIMDERFATFAAFVRGCEAGNDGQLLAGFREWLVVRRGGGRNLAWEALVLHEAGLRPQDLRAPEGGPDGRADGGPGGSAEGGPEGGSGRNALAVATLGRLLDEFLRLRAERGALERIFRDYLEVE